jgi:hypothetical protein
VEERAAKRARLEEPDRDRYDSLLRHLRAGREMELEQRRRRTFGLDIHPIAARLVLAAIVIAVVWMLGIVATDLVRQRVVDTWDGPDASVQSGLLLDGCPVIEFEEDVYLPSWVRFEGRTYRWADLSVPIGSSSIGTTYVPTGYRHDDLELFTVTGTDAVRSGEQVMIRQGDAFVGAIYLASSCG